MVIEKKPLVHWLVYYLPSRQTRRKDNATITQYKTPEKDNWQTYSDRYLHQKLNCQNRKCRLIKDDWPTSDHFDGHRQWLGGGRGTEGEWRMREAAGVEEKSKTMTSSHKMKIQEDATSIWYIFMIICSMEAGIKTAWGAAPEPANQPSAVSQGGRHPGRTATAMATAMPTGTGTADCNGGSGGGGKQTKRNVTKYVERFRWRCLCRWRAC